jgi:hypothetical protein
MVMNMDAADTTRDRWVDDRLRALDPPDTWEPATAVALARFRERAAAGAAAATPRRGFAWGLGFGFGRPSAWIAAASLACLILLLTPATRAAAQRLWDVFFAERVEFVTLDVDKLPRSFTDQRIRLIGPNHMKVASVREAADHARFTPRLPERDALVAEGGAPTLSVSGTITLEWRVNAADLDIAARNAGLADVHFPSQWDGARIGAHTSPLVIASYQHFELIQLMPLAITTPPRFDLGAFTERILRIGGLSPSAARSFAAQMSAAPFALFAISPDEEMTMRQVSLQAGQGTLVHDLNDDGSLQRTTLVWSTPDRLYAISSSLSDDEVIAIANAIPRE